MDMDRVRTEILRTEKEPDEQTAVRSNSAN